MRRDGWTIRDLVTLVEMRSRGWMWPQVASRLGRSVNAVKVTGSRLARVAGRPLDREMVAVLDRVDDRDAGVEWARVAAMFEPLQGGQNDAED